MTAETKTGHPGLNSWRNKFLQEKEVGLLYAIQDQQKQALFLTATELSRRGIHHTVIMDNASYKVPNTGPHKKSQKWLWKNCNEYDPTN
jgi:hypothetical protein